MFKSLQISLLFLLLCLRLLAQQFETLPDEIISGPNTIRFGEILITAKGSLLIASSAGLSEMDGMQLQIEFATGGGLSDNNGKRMYLGKNSWIFKDVYESFAGIKLISGGPDDIIYVVSGNNNLGVINYNLSKAIGHPPFNFTGSGAQKKLIKKIWIDLDGTLFVATDTDTIYTVANATKFFKHNTEDRAFAYQAGLDKDSNYVVILGARPVKQFSLGNGIIPYSFSESPDNKRIVLIGTNNGLYAYDKQTGQVINYFKEQRDTRFTVTNIEADKLGLNIWFSTLEKGMAYYNTFTKGLSFFVYPKKNSNTHALYPIPTFSRKSADEFFVAIADSLPAVFNTSTGKYVFITDTLFSKTKNETTDIKMDAFGNLVVTKGGGLYISRTYLKDNAALFAMDSALFGPYITDITLNGTTYNDTREFYSKYESLIEIDLNYHENNIGIFYSCRGVNKDSLIFSWKLDNYYNDWTITPYSVFGDEMNMILLENLKPGGYLLHIRAKNKSGDWLAKEAQLTIIISPPFWQTWWFWFSLIAGVSLMVFVIVKWRVNAVRRQERLKAKHEKELLELEAKALRAQMNPHFIFNCMNSIKALIQKKEDDKAINYLTTFSKLIRTIFQNSDKRDITLFDEMETCRLYTQLESMRFDNKFSYQFSIDGHIDLKSLLVPALIVQPFIENAIWHGIMPKEEGGYVNVTVKKEAENIYCIIDDNGIGREMSKQNKFKGEPSTHQSKGVHLTQSRLDLDNTLNQRNASVEIIDKTDEYGKPGGTTVILTFKEY